MSKIPSEAASYYDFYKTNGHPKPVHMPGGPSLTRQEFADECDINILMKRYEAHAIGGPGNLGPLVPQYVDLSQAPQDLLGYMALMASAESAFMSLPAQVRKEFDNDPVTFVDFASDPENLPQMRSWGLAPPARADVVPPSSAASQGAPAGVPGASPAAPGTFPPPSPGGAVERS